MRIEDAPDSEDLRAKPYRRLVTAMLELARQDVTGGGPFAITGDYADALRWIRSDSDRPWSFVWCCEVLEMNPDRARARLQILASGKEPAHAV